MTTVIDAMTDEEAFGLWFAGPSWGTWRIVLKGAFALPMTPEELIVFGELAGGREARPGAGCASSAGRARSGA